MFNHCSGCTRSKRLVDYQRSESQRFLLPLFLLEDQSFHEVLVFFVFHCLTIISRVVCHPDSGWNLSETGEEVAGRSRFMGKIRHLRGVRRSTKRLRLSPLHKQQTGQPLQCCPLRHPKKKVQKKVDTLTGLILVLFCMCSTFQPGLQPFLRSRALALPWATLTTQLYEIQNSSAVDGLFGGRPFS